jgi:large subunit ribosomal protein L9
MAYMEVLLREDIENLGDRGQTVRVRLGYGRNYLLPRGLAVRASAANVRQIESEKRVLAKRETREKAAAEASLREFEGGTVTFERKSGDEGRLFGSVTVLDIVHALAAEGKTVDRHKIRLKDPIKTVGEFDVPIRLHRDVVTNLKVVVTPEGGFPAPVEAAAAPVAAAPVPPAPDVDDEDDDDDEYGEYDEQ